MNENKQIDLQKKQELVNFSLNQVAEEVYWITPAGKFIYTNDRVKEKLGYSGKELCHMYIWDVDPDYRAETRKEYWYKLKEEENLHFESLHKTKSGERYPVEITNYYLKYEGEEYEFAFARDISDRERIEREYRELINGMNDTAWVIGFDGKFIEVNNAAVETMGYSREKLLSMGPEDIDPSMPSEEIKRKIKNMKNDKKQVFETVHITKDGNKIPVEISSSRVTYRGEPAILSIARDITERKEEEEKIKYLSFHDNLTELYNRAFLEEEIKRLDVKRQLPFSLIMADLNGLKLINDTYGHNNGDKVLIRTAEILKQASRREDLIARWGGDEFVILLPQTQPEEARKIQARINEKFGRFQLGEEKHKKIPISIAMGLAVKSNPSQDIYKILNDAENKMYQNKLMQSRNVKSNILKTLLESLHEKSKETKEHLCRMQKFASKLGKKIDLSPSELERLSLLAKFHDIGKAIIPIDILNKPGKLNEKEWEIIKQHPVTGYRITSSTQEFAHLADEILSHNEHWDGTGYPRGLKKDNIPLLSRIISIVDAYDVMTNDRPYKKAISQEEALNELKKCAGSQFDPKLVKKFKEIFK